jgi:hypothetical protein
MGARAAVDVAEVSDARNPDTGGVVDAADVQPTPKPYGRVFTILFLGGVLMGYLAIGFAILSLIL